LPNQPPKQPEPFLEVLVHKIDVDPGLTGLCAGYEAGEWRADQCARHLTEWLPEFALTESEREAVGAHNAVRVVAKAAMAVYSSEKYKKRGELGELILHVAMRQVFRTLPAVSKWYFKDSSNDTVKGFDAVHVVAADNSLELWLGEVKFYTDIGDAIGSVVAEMHSHTQIDYLRGEFAAITNKIDDDWPHATRLKRLLDINTSLDEVFDTLCIPVLLTYESPTVGSYSQRTDGYVTAFSEEIGKHWKSFSAKDLPKHVRIHLFLFPMASKARLLESFDERLKRCQELV
jgi:hypothetical protein